MSNLLREPLDVALGRSLAGGHGGWGDAVATWRASDEAERLVRHIDQRVSQGVAVYPARVLRALEFVPLDDVRVVIVGQDPYHGPGQAEGLAFSVPAGVRIPPSLRNIFKELERDLSIPRPASGSLVAWAKQGVLLLNTSLTVEDGQAASHARRGWERLTDALLALAAAECASAPKVFMLWGSHAQAKEPLIAAELGRTGGRALVLTSNHPSPLSATRAPAPFIGSGHFRLANEFLADVYGPEAVIDWRVP